MAHAVAPGAGPDGRGHALAAAREREQSLRDERDRLLAERDHLLTERDHLAATLARISGSRSFRLVDAVWRGRRAMRWALGRPGAWLRARLQGLWRGRGLLNWYAFSFDTSRREREALHGRDLSGVRTPGEPGLVSIVLPVHNGADLVRESLDSILAQTYQRFEVIAIDDGSTDDTAEILDGYAARDPRIRVIHQENRKLPRTLSRGFRLARGEFLTWTSDDNRLKPDFLARMVDCLERHPTWEMAYANLDIIGTDGRPLRDSPWYGGYQVPPGSEHIHLPQDVSDLNVWANNYVGAAFLYRSRAAWLLGDYSPVRFTTEDYDYWMRVNGLLTLRHADFDDTVYEYRFHPKSLTARDEELGITRDRVKLMVFEDFRRDYYLTPALWSVTVAGEASQAVAATLKRRIARVGHALWTAGAFALRDLPRLWTPFVHVSLVEDAAAAAPPPADLPEGALRVLVVAGSGPLPEAADPAWDLCVAARESGVLPRLDGEGYRGWLAIADPEVLLSALDVRVRSAGLARLEREIESEAARPAEGRPCASVVICTYRRNERLSRAIASVARQTLPQSEYEVVVVDNDPADPALRRYVEELRSTWFADRPDGFRLVPCPVVGLSHARNVGIAAARGEVLCFLDDDAVAREDWLEEVCRTFAEHPEAGVIGGHIRLAVPEPRPTALQPGWETYWSQFVTGYQGYTEMRQWYELPWGANWNARRRVLLEMGGFRCRYGRRGNDFAGGEELAAALLARRLGTAVGVAPRAEVLHDVDPGRFTFRHVRRTLVASALVIYRLQRDCYMPMEQSVSDTARRLVGKLPAQARPATGLAGALHHIYRREAIWRLLGEQLRDWRRRRRRPLCLSADRP